MRARLAILICNQASMLSSPGWERCVTWCTRVPGGPSKAGRRHDAAESCVTHGARHEATHPGLGGGCACFMAHGTASPSAASAQHGVSSSMLLQNRVNMPACIVVLCLLCMAPTGTEETERYAAFTALASPLGTKFRLTWPQLTAHRTFTLLTPAACCAPCGPQKAESSCKAPSRLNSLPSTSDRQCRAQGYNTPAASSKGCLRGRAAPSPAHC